MRGCDLPGALSPGRPTLAGAGAGTGSPPYQLSFHHVRQHSPRRLCLLLPLLLAAGKGARLDELQTSMATRGGPFQTYATPGRDWAPVSHRVLHIPPTPLPGTSIGSRRVVAPSA